MLNQNVERWAADFLGNFKLIYEKRFPKDTKNIQKINEVLHDLCWKIKEKEENE